MQNNTTDDIEAFVVIQHFGGNLTAHDNIFADDANSYGFAATGVNDYGKECSSSGTLWSL